MKKILILLAVTFLALHSAFWFYGVRWLDVVVVTRPPQPRPDYVWVDGDWYAVKGKYQYKQGYWTAPPKKNHVWVPGHWDKRKGGWYWVKGHWRKG